MDQVVRVSVETVKMVSGLPEDYGAVKEKGARNNTGTVKKK